MFNINKIGVIFYLLCKLSNIYSLQLNTFSKTLKKLELTKNQNIFYNYLSDDKTSVVICKGVAGSGKTLISTLFGLNELELENKNKIIITRPTVLIDSNDFGALPGNVNDKMEPLLQHIANIISKEYDCSSNLYNIVKDKKIEVIPLEYIRSHSFDNTYIIADEMQNSTKRQMKALLTRIGYNSKLVITGDTDQTDIEGENGLTNFIDKYNRYLKQGGVKFTKLVEFTEEDIKRSEIVKEIIKIYKF